MKDIIKIVKSLEKSALFMKGFSVTLKIKQKNTKVGIGECY